MYEFQLPDLGEGIHEGEILAWHVGAGDLIEEDAPLVDVETDKAAVTLPSPRAGTVVSIHGAPGDVVIVGQVVAVIDDGGEALSVPAAAAVVRGATGEAPVPAARADVGRVTREGPVPAAPATRRLARELGVDIDRLTGRGPAGRITPDDVRRAAGGEVSPGVLAPPPTPVEPSAGATDSAAGRGGASAIPFLDPQPMPDFSRWGTVDREPLRSIRRTIARRMVTSTVLVPHVIHMDEADVTELEALRRGIRDEGGSEPVPTLLAFVVKAVTAALKRAPSFNASLDPDRQEIVYKRYLNIGLAADTPRGLVVPVVKGADRRSVREVSGEIRRLADAAREGTVGVDDLQGGTFTITNIGPLGGIALAPAINYPEVAILGMGRATDQPVVRDGEIVVRRMLPLTLSFDHRVADGADAARFVSHLVRLLSDPRQLLLEV